MGMNYFNAIFKFTSVSKQTLTKRLDINLNQYLVQKKIHLYMHHNGRLFQGVTSQLNCVNIFRNNIFSIL